MEELASVFFHSRTQAHVFHTRVKGTGALALHLALETYYTEIVPLIDGLIESYQGMHGLIEYKDVKGVDNNAEKENIINYFTKLCTYLEAARKNEKLQHSWMQNDIDNIATLLYSTKYKLTNLG
jgi:DNA-binding ferritin-like protein